MKVRLNKSVKVNNQSGTLRVSIPNMLHTMINLKTGNSLLYKSMEYNDQEDELVLTIKIIRNEDKDNWYNTIKIRHNHKKHVGSTYIFTFLQKNIKT